MCTMVITQDKDLATNVNNSMGTGSMAAADVTQASKQAKTRDWFQTLVHGAKRWVPRVQHGESRDEACDREGGCSGEARPTQER